MSTSTSFAAALRADLEAGASGALVFATLPHLSTLRAEGPDAIAFLHGQVTCDVSGLAEGGWTYGAYCSPKGRMLASFLLAREGAALRMLLAGDIAAATHKRLSMFVLRSKVTITNETGRNAVFGLAGRELESALASIGAGPLAGAHRAVRTEAGDLWIRASANRLLGVVAAERAAAVLSALTKCARPVDPQCWHWLEINEGVPWIEARTQDQLVPQMANLEVLGAVSFSKGCYTGQEVVARAQHLGKIKRRMFLASVDPAGAPQPGDAIFGSDLGDQAAGVVVSAAPSPRGDIDVLAVMPLSTAHGGTGHLRALDGPKLALRPLPYAMP
jgi:hypothetical protein